MTGTKEIIPKPVILDMMEYCIYGTGNPAWGDPRDVCTKLFSRHTEGCRMTMERLKCIGLMERCSPQRKMYLSLMDVLERLSRRYLADIWRSKER